MGIIGSICGKNSDETESILSRHLNSDFIVFPMSPRPCANDEFIEIERKIGFTLPKQYKANLAGKFPGIYMEAKRIGLAAGKTI